MNLEDIKHGMAELPQDQEDHLAAYLVHLRHLRDDDVRAKISERLDDKNPESWLTLNELKERWKD